MMSNSIFNLIHLFVNKVNKSSISLSAQQSCSHHHLHDFYCIENTSGATNQVQDPNKE